MSGWTGSRRWLYVATGAVLAKGLLEEFGLVKLPYIWGPAVLLFAGTALSLSVAFGLRDNLQR
jgi:hypothetical protein